MSRALISLTLLALLAGCGDLGLEVATSFFDDEGMIDSAEGTW